MASDNECYSCENDPNFAVICAFLERFGVTCGLAEVDFLELQEMLENTQEVPQVLVDIHIKLLRKLRKSVPIERWERCLIKFCHGYSVQDAWEIERFGYKKASLSSKLRVLKELLEVQFDLNVKFKTEINKMSAEELRSQPLGKDKLGHAYWYQSDNKCQLRIYKEDPDEETWTLVAKDRDGLVNLMSELNGETVNSKSSSDPALNEESSNSLLDKPLIDTGQADSNNSSDSAAATIELKKVTEIRQTSATPTTNNTDDSNGSNSKVNGDDSVAQKTTSIKENSEENSEEKQEASEMEEQSKSETSKDLATVDDQKSKKRRKNVISSSDEDSNSASDKLELSNKTKKPKLATAPNSDKSESNDNDDKDQKSESTAPVEENEEVSEPIEEPVQIIKGQGSGADNECENSMFEIVGDVIEEPVMYFYGTGAGAECLTGNGHNSDDTEKSTSVEKTSGKSDRNSECASDNSIFGKNSDTPSDLIAKNSSDPAQCVNRNSPFKLGTIIDSRKSDPAARSAQIRNSSKKSRWDVETSASTSVGDLQGKIEDVSLQNVEQVSAPVKENQSDDNDTSQLQVLESKTSSPKKMFFFGPACQRFSPKSGGATVAFGSENASTDPETSSDPSEKDAKPQDSDSDVVTDRTKQESDGENTANHVPTLQEPTIEADDVEEQKKEPIAQPKMAASIVDYQDTSSSCESEEVVDSRMENDSSSANEAEEKSRNQNSDEDTTNESSATTNIIESKQSETSERPDALVHDLEKLRQERHRLEEENKTQHELSIEERLQQLEGEIEVDTAEIGNSAIVDNETDVKFAEDQQSITMATTSHHTSKCVEEEDTTELLSTLEETSDVDSSSMSQKLQVTMDATQKIVKDADSDSQNKTIELNEIEQTSNSIPEVSKIDVSDDAKSTKDSADDENLLGIAEIKCVKKVAYTVGHEDTSDESKKPDEAVLVTSSPNLAEKELNKDEKSPVAMVTAPIDTEKADVPTEETQKQVTDGNSKTIHMLENMTSDFDTDASTHSKNAPAIDIKAVVDCPSDQNQVTCEISESNVKAGCHSQKVAPAITETLDITSNVDESCELADSRCTKSRDQSDISLLETSESALVAAKAESISLHGDAKSFDVDSSSKLSSRSDGNVSKVLEETEAKAEPSKSSESSQISTQETNSEHVGEETDNSKNEVPESSMIVDGPKPEKVSNLPETSDNTSPSDSTEVAGSLQKNTVDQEELESTLETAENSTKAVSDLATEAVENGDDSSDNLDHDKVEQTPTASSLERNTDDQPIVEPATGDPVGDSKEIEESVEDSTGDLSGKSEIYGTILQSELQAHSATSESNISDTPKIVSVDVIDKADISETVKTKELSKLPASSDKTEIFTDMSLESPANSKDAADNTGEDSSKSQVEAGGTEIAKNSTTSKETNNELPQSNPDDDDVKISETEALNDESDKTDKNEVLKPVEPKSSELDNEKIETSEQNLKSAALNSDSIEATTSKVDIPESLEPRTSRSKQAVEDLKETAVEIVEETNKSQVTKKSKSQSELTKQAEFSQDLAKPVVERNADRQIETKSIEIETGKPVLDDNTRETSPETKILSENSVSSDLGNSSVPNLSREKPESKKDGLTDKGSDETENKPDSESTAELENILPAQTSHSNTKTSEISNKSKSDETVEKVDPSDKLSDKDSTKTSVETSDNAAVSESSAQDTNLDGKNPDKTATVQKSSQPEASNEVDKKDTKTDKSEDQKTSDENDATKNDKPKVVSPVAPPKIGFLKVKSLAQINSETASLIKPNVEVKPTNSPVTTVNTAVRSVLQNTAITLTPVAAATRSFRKNVKNNTTTAAPVQPKPAQSKPAQPKPPIFPAKKLLAQLSGLPGQNLGRFGTSPARMVKKVSESVVVAAPPATPYSKYGTRMGRPPGNKNQKVPPVVQTKPPQMPPVVQKKPAQVMSPSIGGRTTRAATRSSQRSAEASPVAAPSPAAVEKFAGRSSLNKQGEDKEEIVAVAAAVGKKGRSRLLKTVVDKEDSSEHTKKMKMATDKAAAPSVSITPVTTHANTRQTRNTRSKDSSIAAAAAQPVVTLTKISSNATTQKRSKRNKGNENDVDNSARTTLRPETPASVISVIVPDDPIVVDSSSNSSIGAGDTLDQDPLADPLAMSDEETNQQAPKVMSLSTFSMDFEGSPVSTPIPVIPATTRRGGLRKRNREKSPSPERENAMDDIAVGSKRIKMRGKRTVDVKLRKSIEEQKAIELSSSDDDNNRNKRTSVDDEEASTRSKKASAKGAKKKKAGWGGARKPFPLIKKSADDNKDDGKKSENTAVGKKSTKPAPSSGGAVIESSEVKGVDGGEAAPPVKKTKVKHKRLLMCLDITLGMPPKFDTESPVRQSRRLATLKIKEQADRKRLEDEVRKEQDKHKKKHKQQMKKQRPSEEKPKVQHHQVEDHPDDEDTRDSTSKKSSKKRKRQPKPMSKLYDAYNPWKSSSESSTSNGEEEEVEEEEEEYVEHLPAAVSDHEFSPESELEEEDAVPQPLKRARTARKESDVEEEVDDCPCKKCLKSDHPEWILLCDSCDSGWHCSCLRPPLFVIPEGDWFCPPCQHAKLLQALDNKLADYDRMLNKKQMEDRRKERLAYVGISLNNVLPNKMKEHQQHKRHVTAEDEDGEGHSDGDNASSRGSDSKRSSSRSGSSSSSSSSDDEPIYQLRQRRQAQTYRFNDYDDLINSAIQDEMDAVKGAGNQGRGKDINTIINAGKEEEKEEQEKKSAAQLAKSTNSTTEGAAGDDKKLEPLPPVVPENKEPRPVGGKNINSDDEDDDVIKPVNKRKKVLGQRKKHRKLNSLDISSEDDDEGSDEDFKGSSSDSEDEQEDDLESVDTDDLDTRRGGRRGAKHTDPVRRSTRARVNRYDADFIDDASSDDSPRRKKKKSQREDSESEASSDRSWGRRKKKPSRSTRRHPLTSSISPKKKRSKKKKKRRDDDSDPEVYKKKKPKIKYGLDEDDEDEGPLRRTRGKKINYVDALGSDSEEDRVKRPPPRIIESEEEYVANEDEDVEDEDDKVSTEEQENEENSSEETGTATADKKSKKITPKSGGSPKKKTSPQDGVGDNPTNAKNDAATAALSLLATELQQQNEDKVEEPKQDQEKQAATAPLTEKSTEKKAEEEGEKAEEVEKKAEEVEKNVEEVKIAGTTAGKEDLSPLEQINKNLEEMDENEMEKMMEEEEYANEQLKLVAMQLEREKKRRQLLLQQQQQQQQQQQNDIIQPQPTKEKDEAVPRVEAASVYKPEPTQFPAQVHEPIVGSVDSLIVNAENNDELSEPPGVSLPLFAELGVAESAPVPPPTSIVNNSNGGPEVVPAPTKKRRGRGPGKKTLAEAVANLGGKSTAASRRKQQAQAAAADGSPTSKTNSRLQQEQNLSGININNTSGSIEIAAPPQPFSQSQPQPSVITRMLQQQNNKLPSMAGVGGGPQRTASPNTAAPPGGGGGGGDGRYPPPSALVGSIRPKQFATMPDEERPSPPPPHHMATQQQQQHAMGPHHHGQYMNSSGPGGMRPSAQQQHQIPGGSPYRHQIPPPAGSPMNHHHYQHHPSSPSSSSSRGSPLPPQHPSHHQMRNVGMAVPPPTSSPQQQQQQHHLYHNTTHHRPAMMDPSPSGGGISTSAMNMAMADRGLHSPHSAASGSPGPSPLGGPPALAGPVGINKNEASPPPPPYARGAGGGGGGPPPMASGGNRFSMVNSPSSTRQQQQHPMGHHGMSPVGVGGPPPTALQPSQHQRPPPSFGTPPPPSQQVQHGPPPPGNYHHAPPSHYGSYHGGGPPPHEDPMPLTAYHQHPPPHQGAQAVAAAPPYSPAGAGPADQHRAVGAPSPVNHMNQNNNSDSNHSAVVSGDVIIDNSNNKTSSSYGEAEDEVGEEESGGGEFGGLVSYFSSQREEDDLDT